MVAFSQAIEAFQPTYQRKPRLLLTLTAEVCHGI